MTPHAKVFLFAFLLWEGVIAVSSAEQCGASGICESQDGLVSHEKNAAALLQVGNKVHTVKPVKEHNVNLLEEATLTPLQEHKLLDKLKTTFDKLTSDGDTGDADKPKTRTLAVVADKEQQSENEAKADLSLPPNQGPILWNMIRSEPWNCDLVPDGDPRQGSCHLEAKADDLKPENINCVEGSDHGLSCSIEHANSWRTMNAVGALPCCSTPPFCAAPECAQRDVSEAPKCTKREPSENVAYLKTQEAWPAYHGWGGSFELDTLKFLDMLSCHGPADKCPVTPFDMSIDLGANTGYYTEKLSVRNWAKHYVMIEANPMTSAVLENRWGQPEWRKTWFSQQVKLKEGQQIPDIAIITKALSNHSDGVLDMCVTEGSMAMAEAGCTVPISAVDDIVPQGLPDAMQQHFKEAQSAFLKVDTEGMDELVLRGMRKLFEEKRGKYEDGTPRHLINFLQFEYSPTLMSVARGRENFEHYDLKSVTEYMESIGFETFMIGPRYLPLSHGSWNDEFVQWTQDANNNAGKRANYPEFGGGICPYCKDMNMASFCSDIFAIRSSHPRATEIKVGLGACKESKDFDVHDKQYSFKAK